MQTAKPNYTESTQSSNDKKNIFDGNVAIIAIIDFGRDHLRLKRHSLYVSFRSIRMRLITTSHDLYTSIV